MVPFLLVLFNLQAESLCINPLYLMIPVTLACTYAYMLPAATPPNAIVFSFGTISILDMVCKLRYCNCHPYIGFEKFLLLQTTHLLCRDTFLLIALVVSFHVIQ